MPSVDRRDARERFIFGTPPEFFHPFSRLEEEESVLRASLLAFRKNLSSALLVGNLPFQLVSDTVLNLRFNQIHSAERIRSLKRVGPGEPVSSADEDRAREIAERRMEDELGDPSVTQRNAQETLDRLNGLLGVVDFRDSSDELLRQVVVMTWGAFETLASDLTRLLLNARPDLTRRLSEAKRFRDALTGRSLFDALESSKFDIVARMGDLMLELSRWIA